MSGFHSNSETNSVLNIPPDIINIVIFGIDRVIFAGFWAVGGYYPIYGPFRFYVIHLKCLDPVGRECRAYSSTFALVLAAQ